MTLYFWGSCCALFIIGFFSWLLYFKYIEYTNDAYVQGNLVYITPLEPGFVTSIHTDDSFLVKKGQLLVTLDDTNAKIALQRAKEALANKVRDVCQMFHSVFVYQKEIELKIATLIKDAQDYLHREGVFKEQGVSLEDYEHAIAALKAQFASLEMSKAQYLKSLSLIQGTTLQNHPLVIAASDEVRQAFVNLYRCNIYSPVDGLAAQRTIQVGMWVPAGQPLMGVIPLDQIWINANYKETQIKRMRIGQKVDITTDLWGKEHIFHGTIVGLPGGAGNAFSLLPPQNLSGNWIKIVQRLPVRVALDPKEIEEHPLRIGLSCESLIDTRGHAKGLLIPQTSAGSPLYETSIFQIEEKGDKALIKSIIESNLDPTLAIYQDTPIELPKIDIDFASLLEEAYLQEERLKREILEE